MASASSSTSSIEAGRVGRPHGLDGSFHVTRPEIDLLREGMPVHVGERATSIVAVRGTPQRPLLSIEGCSSRAEAEALRGEPLWVDRSSAPPLEEDEFWADDLVGCRVVDGARAVGEVERVLAYPSCEVLVVGDLLVPLVDDAVRTVDLEARVVDVDMGFLGEG